MQRVEQPRDFCVNLLHRFSSSSKCFPPNNGKQRELQRVDKLRHYGARKEILNFSSGTISCALPLLLQETAVGSGVQSSYCRGSAAAVSKIMLAALLHWFSVWIRVCLIWKVFRAPGRYFEISIKFNNIDEIDITVRSILNKPIRNVIYF